VSAILNFIQECPGQSVIAAVLLVLMCGAVFAPWKSRAFMACVFGVYGIVAFFFMCSMFGLYF
jgi:hypothetical protein